MFGERRREEKREEAADELARKQAAEAVNVTETDDTSVDPDEKLEREEEPIQPPETV